MTIARGLLSVLPHPFFDERKEIRVPLGANYDVFTQTPRFELDSQTRFGDSFRNLQIVAHILIHAFSHVLLRIDSGMNLQGLEVSPAGAHNCLAGSVRASVRADATYATEWNLVAAGTIRSEC